MSAPLRISDSNTTSRVADGSISTDLRSQRRVRFAPDSVAKLDSLLGLSRRLSFGQVSGALR
jgi:hypothetical protein